MGSKELQILLEKYIRNELSEAERTSVEERLLYDREAREQLSRMEFIFKQIQLYPETLEITKAESDKETSSRKSSNYQSNKFYAIAASLILIGSLGFAYVFLSGDNETNLSVSERNQLQQTYADAYDNNPYLEEIIDDVQRSNRSQISMIKPDGDLRVSIQEERFEYQFEFEGDAGQAETNGVLELKIYPNESEAYIEDEPVKVSPVSVSNSTISTSVSTMLTPGLYYYTIENTESYDILAAGRIILE